MQKLVFNCNFLITRARKQMLVSMVGFSIMLDLINTAHLKHYGVIIICMYLVLFTIIGCKATRKE